MAVCGIRLAAVRAFIPRPQQLLATHRALHSGRGLSGPSWSRVVACRRFRTVGVCGSALRVVGGRTSSTMAPISMDGLDPGQIVDKCIAENKVMIFSKSFCPFCHKVRGKKSWSSGICETFFLL